MLTITDNRPTANKYFSKQYDILFSSKFMSLSRHAKCLVFRYGHLTKTKRPDNNAVIR